MFYTLLRVDIFIIYFLFIVVETSLKWREKKQHRMNLFCDTEGLTLVVR